MMKTKKAKVSLLSCTANPAGVLATVWDASRVEGPLGNRNREEHIEMLRNAIRTDLPIAEMIDFIFILDNVSIAFREQMVRHRVGTLVGDRLGCDIIPELGRSSWWTQSMRVLNMGTFYESGKFEIPESVRQSEDSHCRFLALLQHCQDVYNQMVTAGIPNEDARMVIPLAATHRVVWKLNLQALKHIVSKRCCWILQAGFWFPIIRGMLEELKKIDPIFSELASPPCFPGKDDNFGCCLFCKDNEYRIAGSDPLPPCPLYLHYHCSAAVKTWHESTNPAWELVEPNNLEEATEPRRIGKTWRAEDPRKQAKFNLMTDVYEDLWMRDVRDGTGIRL